MAFCRVFEKTNVATCLQPGLQALGKYSQLIIINPNGNNNAQTLIEGSVDIDTCLVRQYPQDHRWDYAFGYDDHIYYVEVHHVNDSEVSVVIEKYRWLREWQNGHNNASELKKNSSYYWVSSGKGGLTPNSRYTRMLTTAGLPGPVNRLRIP